MVFVIIVADSNIFLDYDIKKQSAMRWRNYKLLTGDPGYPDYPIPIPPNETLSEDIDLGRVRIFFTTQW